MPRPEEQAEGSHGSNYAGNKGQSRVVADRKHERSYQQRLDDERAHEELRCRPLPLVHFRSLCDEWRSPRPGKRAGELGEDSQVRVKLDPLKPAHPEGQ